MILRCAPKFCGGDVSRNVCACLFLGGERSIYFLLNIRYGPLATNAPMLEKLAITATSERLVCNLCALSHGYHTLKSNYQEQLHHSSATDIAKITVDVLRAAVLRFRSMLPRSSEQSRACSTPARLLPDDPAGPAGNEHSATECSHEVLLEEVGREFCEPECSGLPAGMHHGCCPQSTFLREAREPVEGLGESGFEVRAETGHGDMSDYNN